MSSAKLIEYISYKYWVLRVTDWDVWQEAIRSHLFINPIGKS